ncbi:MAG: PD40 domain-containing protein, partial [Rhodobacteraceae bacterium]|nr:PD40 domain-containing protein [Paracoccaceae bacterium]
MEAPVQFADWKAINAQALIAVAAGQRGDRVSVRFRLWDVFAQTQLGEGLQFEGTAQAWRRMGHKVADAVYSRLTGEGGYFDSRVAYIAASGPKSARRKQIAVMDYDGANPVMLTDGNALVLTPRISRSASQILYTSYEQGAPRVLMIEAGGGRRQVLDDAQGMTFAPRFSPDGSRAVYSASTGTGSDIFVVDLASRRRAQLTQTASIDTAPAFSNDGGQIVFESDR